MSTCNLVTNFIVEPQIISQSTDMELALRRLNGSLDATGWALAKDARYSGAADRDFMVAPGQRLTLGDIDPNYDGGYPSAEAALPETRILLHKLNELQHVMYADQRHSLVIVLQGLDASGKDGIMRHLLTAMNPAGCQVTSFKEPTQDELDHDFLWRVHPHVPAKGRVAIFNRSYYEDVLIVRVHRLAPTSLWDGRYEQINEFEKLLTFQNNTTILKFLLYISKEEQLVRFRQRLEDPSRQWKISEADYKEREYWDSYVDAFEEMLYRTSTAHAPWFVIPSNCKWFRDLAVAQIVTRKLAQLDLKWPKPVVDLADIRRRYHAAEKSEVAVELN